MLSSEDLAIPVPAEALHQQGGSVICWISSKCRSHEPALSSNELTPPPLILHSYHTEFQRQYHGW